MLLYEDHRAVVYALAFSPNGSTLATQAGSERRVSAAQAHARPGRPHSGTRTEKPCGSRHRFSPGR